MPPAARQMRRDDKEEVPDLTRLSSSALLTLYARVLGELNDRMVTRSTNNPAADVAEYLAVDALALTLAPKSTKGYDATDAKGRRYEIKGRRVTAHNKSRQLSPFRDLPKRQFDYFVGVLFKEDFSVLQACILPFDVVHQEAKFRNHVNGSILHLRDSIWQKHGVRDITAVVKAAEARLLRPISFPTRRRA